MTIDPSGRVQAAPEAGSTRRKPATPEEAARQFEAVLVRQFVSTMTKGLFDASLSGEDGPGWMASQQDAQRDIMNDVLTDHLVESGAFRLSDLLLRQWAGSRTDDTSTEPEGDTP